MRFPSKVTPYQASILAVFPYILSLLQKEPLTPSVLYKKTKNRVEDISEFLDVLDCLLALGKIDIDSERGLLIYVD